MPPRVKKLIYVIGMFDTYYVMSWITVIPSVANTRNNIYLGGTLLDEFTSTKYYDKNKPLSCCFNNIHLFLLITFIINKKLRMES